MTSAPGVGEIQAPWIVRGGVGVLCFSWSPDRRVALALPVISPEFVLHSLGGVWVRVLTGIPWAPREAALLSELSGSIVLFGNWDQNSNSASCVWPQQSRQGIGVFLRLTPGLPVGQNPKQWSLQGQGGSATYPGSPFTDASRILKSN
jgi:hypothetical protein